MERITHSGEETRQFGREFAGTLEPGTTVLFSGSLGAGKTTFIQGILESLGADRPFVSPTFVLMKQYDLARPTRRGVARLYHADAYRIDDPSEFEKIGFTEWCTDRTGIVLLEWPEKVSALLPTERVVCVSIEPVDEESRFIDVVYSGEKRTKYHE